MPVGALNLLTVAVLKTDLGNLEEPNAWTPAHQMSWNILPVVTHGQHQNAYRGILSFEQMDPQVGPCSHVLQAASRE